MLRGVQTGVLGGGRSGFGEVSWAGGGGGGGGGEGYWFLVEGVDVERLETEGRLTLVSSAIRFSELSGNNGPVFRAGDG
ncbi:hypothetical protein GCM10020220_046570 [Nonomuraea rubra]